MTHHFMLEFVDSDLYFVQDKNNFINPLLQVGSGSGSGWPKISGTFRIRILIPELFPVMGIRIQRNKMKEKPEIIQRRKFF